MKVFRYCRSPGADEGLQVLIKVSWYCRFPSNSKGLQVLPLLHKVSRCSWRSPVTAGFQVMQKVSSYCRFPSNAKGLQVLPLLRKVSRYYERFSGTGTCPPDNKKGQHENFANHGGMTIITLTNFKLEKLMHGRAPYTFKHPWSLPR